VGVTNLEPVILLVGWNRLRESKSFTNLVANQWGFSGTYNDMYYNSFAYDANGNITQQIRLSQSGQKIEDMVYRYKTNSSGKLLRNRLYHINDEVDASDWADDIDDMGVFENNPLLIETANNYSYDEEGRLIKDTQEGIKEIVWRVDGKVRAVIFDSLSQKPHLLFDYDAFGRRIAKHLYDNQSEVLMKTTYYLRDASGNQLSTYVHEVLNEQTHFTLKELHLYGSSHLGMVADSVNLFTHTPSSHINTILGLRYYNLTNHLGNVLTTLSDIKIPLSDDNETVSGYDAAIVNIYDYSPFGVYLDGRTIESKYMPFGFNGMQRDDEIYGEGNSIDFGARMYDPRLGRWLSRDPLEAKYTSLSPYNFVANTPIQAIDPDGRYIIFINGEVGEFVGKLKKSTNTDRASVDYWSQRFVDKVVRQFSFYRSESESYTFRDGDVGSSADTRYGAGAMQAKQDFTKILSELEKNDEGKIIETIKLVSHSKGSAYALGYMDAWNELRNSKEHKDKFSGRGGLVEFNLMLAPHQSGSLKATAADPTFPNQTMSVAITHDWDVLSDDGVKGDVVNIQTDNNAWAWEQVKAHTIDGFHFEAEAVIQVFISAKAGHWTPSYRSAAEGASKNMYNRETDSYDEND
jgi:RHS repeat-associated protein